MYNLSKSSKKVSDLSVGDSVVVYAKGLPYQTKMNIDEMLVNVFERMSRESKVTDNEISRVLSENMLDLLL